MTSTPPAFASSFGPFVGPNSTLAIPQPKGHVLGFLFDEPKDHVVLVLKNGRLNGVQGTLEPGDTPSRAMFRSFLERTDIYIYPSRWQLFATLKDLGADPVSCFTASMNHSAPVPQILEYVGDINLVDITPENEDVEPTARWLIPLARDFLVSGTFDPITVEHK